jgi:predicted RNase H-like nuclease
MEIYSGIDGCHGGWFLVILAENGEWDFVRIPAANQLLFLLILKNSRLIFIDMPIGLKNTGQFERNCDREARKILGSRMASSVFRVPTRAAVYSTDYDSACIENMKITGKKLSKQSWNIAPRIKAIDRLICENNELLSILHESHPEICFWSLAGEKQLTHPKKTDEGIEERIRILEKYFPETRKLYQQALASIPRKYLARDDILDALVLAISARHVKGCGMKILPEEPETDELGIPMQIVYS